MSIHFKCNKDNIIKALNIVDKAVGQKNIKPILEGILIEAKNNKILFKSTNLVLSIETILIGDILKEGVVVVAERIFYDIISKYSDGEIDIQLEEDKLKISNPYSNTILNVMDSSEFPFIPIVKQENEILIKEYVLKDMINTTIFSAAISESKGILTGLLFEVCDNVLNIVSLDAYRLAFRKTPLEKECIDCNAVIPSHSLREIYKILKDTDDHINMYFSNNMCFIKTQDTKIFTLLLEGDFVKYKSILPKEYQTRVSLKTKDIYSSVERASILARSEDEKVIKFNIEEKTLLITSASERGRANEIVDIYLQGKDLDIFFNSKYLIEALRVINIEDIVMEFNKNISPCVIKSDHDDSFLYLILPVHPK